MKFLLLFIYNKKNKNTIQRKMLQLTANFICFHCLSTINWDYYFCIVTSLCLLIFPYPLPYLLQVLMFLTYSVKRFAFLDRYLIQIIHSRSFISYFRSGLHAKNKTWNLSAKAIKYPRMFLQFFLEDTLWFIRVFNRLHTQAQTI